MRSPPSSTARRATPAIGLALAVLCGSPLRAHAETWWGRDKALHAGLSAGLAVTGYGVSAFWLRSPAARAAAGAGFALTLGAGKELYDMTAGGDPSWRDLTWDLIGTAGGIGIAWLVDTLLFEPSARPSAREPPRVAQIAPWRSARAVAPYATSLDAFSWTCRE